MPGSPAPVSSTSDLADNRSALCHHLQNQLPNQRSLPSRAVLLPKHEDQFAPRLRLLLRLNLLTARPLFAHSRRRPPVVHRQQCCASASHRSTSSCETPRSLGSRLCIPIYGSGDGKWWVCMSVLDGTWVGNCIGPWWPGRLYKSCLGVQKMEGGYPLLCLVPPFIL